MFHEVATLVHPIESSKPAVLAKGIRLMVPLEAPRLLEGRRDKALHDKNKAGDFVLISATSVIRLCRLDKESFRDARRRFL